MRSSFFAVLFACLVCVPSAFASSAVVITHPANGATVVGNGVSVSLATASGVVSASFYIDGSYYASTPPSTITWDTTKVSNGSHTISATAYGSNKSVMGSSSITVSVSNPIAASNTTTTALKLTSPIAGSRVSGMISIAATKPTGAWGENFYVDGNFLTTTPPYSFSWNTAQVANGAHTISVVAYGQNGKMGATSLSIITANSVTLVKTPTPAPTPVPTPVRTAIPTTVPTVVPTIVPTTVPTKVPTVAPTTVPTPVPTAVPTAVRTSVPTVAPTAVPTAAPTTAPTTAPTVAPTVAPTAVPTVAPTTAPTTAPTVAPTVAPTAAPTPIPTAVPTVAPTALPTTTATAVPTASPTAQPAVIMVAPGNNSTVSGTIYVTAQKNSSAVSWINFYCDGEWFASSPPYSVTWDSTTMPDGPHTLSATAYGVGSVNLGYASTNINVLNNVASATATPTSTPTAVSSGSPTATPTPATSELRPTNQIPNNAMPSASDLATFHSGVGACGGLNDCSYMQAVNGQFTGTTTAIIEYESDKWCPNCTILNPLDGQTYSFRDLSKAIAVNETNWYHWRSASMTSPDPITGSMTLTPSHGDLENVSASEPYAGSWGLFQIAEGANQGWPSSYRLSATSTAFNADFKLAEQMGVEQGHLYYLTDPSRAQIAMANGYAPYATYTDSNGIVHPASTDVNQRRWGAVGNWYSGGWYDSGAISYINQVQQILHNQPWTQPGF